MVEFGEVTATDAEQLALCMRQVDRDEVWASGRHTAPQAVRRALAMSTRRWTARLDGGLVGIFGVAPLSMIGGIGSPWFLGTPLVAQHPREMIRFGRLWVTHMRTGYPHLRNYVHAENETSVRWLAWLGFTIHDPVPYGHGGEMFHLFEMRACADQ